MSPVRRAAPSVVTVPAPWGATSVFDDGSVHVHVAVDPDDHEDVAGLVRKAVVHQVRNLLGVTPGPIVAGAVVGTATAVAARRFGDATLGTALVVGAAAATAVREALKRWKWHIAGACFGYHGWRLVVDSLYVTKHLGFHVASDGEQGRLARVLASLPRQWSDTGQLAAACAMQRAVDELDEMGATSEDTDDIDIEDVEAVLHRLSDDLERLAAWDEALEDRNLDPSATAGNLVEQISGWLTTAGDGEGTSPSATD